MILMITTASERSKHESRVESLNVSALREDVDAPAQPGVCLPEMSQPEVERAAAPSPQIVGRLHRVLLLGVGSLYKTVAQVGGIVEAWFLARVVLMKWP